MVGCSREYSRKREPTTLLMFERSFVCAHRQLQRVADKALMCPQLKGKPIARWGRKASGLKPNGVR